MAVHAGVFVEVCVVVAEVVCQTVDVDVHVAFTVFVLEAAFAVWMDVCPAHVVVT